MQLLQEPEKEWEEQSLHVLEGFMGAFTGLSTQAVAPHGGKRGAQQGCPVERKTMVKALVSQAKEVIQPIENHRAFFTDGLVVPNEKKALYFKVRYFNRIHRICHQSRRCLVHLSRMPH